MPKPNPKLYKKPTNTPVQSSGAFAAAVAAQDKTATVTPPGMFAKDAKPDNPKDPAPTAGKGPEKRGRGRPAKAPKKIRDNRIAVLLTDAEQQALTNKLDGRPMSYMIRRLLWSHPDKPFGDLDRDLVD